MELSSQDLRKKKYNDFAPLQLSLQTGDKLIIHSVLRLIPARRLVGYGQWQNKPVFIKLFFHHKDGARHLAEDVQGIQLLQKKAIKTPALYYQGKTQDGQIHVLLLEHIPDAKNFKEIWQTGPPITEALMHLRSIIKEVAHQHQHGVLQIDCNIRNHLLKAGEIYTLDGAYIKQFPLPVPQQESIDILAKFFSYLSSTLHDQIPHLLADYLKQRHWELSPQEIKQFHLQILTWRTKRFNSLMDKITRESRDISVIHTRNLKMVFDRQYASSSLLQFIKNPDIHLNTVLIESLLTDKQMTLAKIKIDHQEFLLCIHGFKNIFLTIKKLFKPTATLWSRAHQMLFDGCHSPKPIAYIEKRFLRIPIKTYFLCESSPHLTPDFFYSNFTPFEHSAKFRMLY